MNVEMRQTQKAQRTALQNKTIVNRFQHFFEVFNAKLDDFRIRNQMRAQCLADQPAGNGTRCHQFVGKKHDMISGYLFLGDFNAYSHCKEARADGTCVVWSDILQGEEERLGEESDVVAESIFDGRLNFSKTFGWSEDGDVQEGVADLSSARSKGPTFPPTCHVTRFTSSIVR